jgi:hypothetical protein
MIVLGWHRRSQKEEYLLAGTDNRGFSRDFVTSRDSSVRLRVESSSSLSNDEAADAELLLRHSQRAREDIIFPMTDQMTMITQGASLETSVVVGPDRDYWMGFLVVFRADGSREYRTVTNPGAFIPPGNPNVVVLDTPISLNMGDEVFPGFQGFLRDGGSITRDGYNNNTLSLTVESRLRFGLVRALPVITPIIGKATKTPLSEGLETTVRLPQEFFDNGLGPVAGEPETSFLTGRRQLTFRPQSLAEKRALRTFLLSLQGKVGRFILPDFSPSAMGPTLPLAQNDVSVFCNPRSGIPLTSLLGDYLVARVGGLLYGSRIIGAEDNTLVIEPFPVDVPVGSPVGLGFWCRSDTNTLTFESTGPQKYRMALVARETDGPAFTPTTLNPKVNVSLAYLPVWVNEIPPSFPVDVSLAVVLVAEIGLPPSFPVDVSLAVVLVAEIGLTETGL